MAQVFATVRLAVPTIDPKTRQVVGQDTREISKMFGHEDTVDDIHAWTEELQATGCTLRFETKPLDKGNKNEGPTDPPAVAGTRKPSARRGANKNK